MLPDAVLLSVFVASHSSTSCSLFSNSTSENLHALPPIARAAVFINREISEGVGITERKQPQLS
jgi:hypothetical protein